MSNLTKTDNNGNGQLANRDVFEDFEILDVYSPTGVAPAERQNGKNHIATISAGRKVEMFSKKLNKTILVPQATDDGTIYISGDAPALVKALKENDGKSLTIMFPTNDPKDFIQQSFKEYSSGKLLSFGDKESITVINGGNRKTYLNGTPEYERAKSKCKVVGFIYFTLAEWTENGADMVFGDGVGLYRMRFTSRHSLTSIKYAIKDIYDMTGGIIAGIPFDCFLRKEGHPDPSGVRREVWIWQFRTRPKGGIRLDAMKFRQLADHGMKQMELLQLKAPPETIDDAISEAETEGYVDPDAIEGDVVPAESEVDDTPDPYAPCDPEQARKDFFGLAASTSYAESGARAAFIEKFTSGKTKSLKTFLEGATVADAAALCQAIGDAAKAEMELGAVPASQSVPPPVSPDVKKCGRKLVKLAKMVWGEHYPDRLTDALGGEKIRDTPVEELNKLIVSLEEQAKSMDEMIPSNNETPRDAPQGGPVEPPHVALPNEELVKEARAKRDASTAGQEIPEDDPFSDDDGDDDNHGEARLFDAGTTADKTNHSTKQYGEI